VSAFVSTVTNKLDAKGRVSIPAPFRLILAEQGTRGVYAIPSFVNSALDAFGETLIADVQARLAQFDPFLSAEHDAQAQAILAAAQSLGFDDEGRVRLPDEFIAHAQLKDRVSFVGLGRKFEIWNPELLAPVQAARIEAVRAKRGSAQ
jgi:MraZ protein